MSKMTDPSAAMISFQRVIKHGGLPLQSGALDKSLVLHVDHPTKDGLRLTYAMLEGRTVTAFVTFAKVDFLEGLPCFQVGYAVPETYRKQGRAKKVLEAAIAEMKHGFAKTPLGTFYIEAIVGTGNVASQRIAEEVLSASPKAVTDNVSGESALQYIRKIEQVT